ncbi:hypothetical protein DY000_02040463 [Brassica cretica]|uniref:Neurobeachin beta-propeller domain-containing protein n=1 Tax=Brassica cretica TaxID=69181 RepID=A0ABQ7BH66_BRACR|nr:hypothetical protein DY000_02040463 [Brassica cretica]
MPRKNQLRLSFDGVWHERLVSIQACCLVVEFVIFVGKVEKDLFSDRKLVPLKFFGPQPQGRELSSSHQRRNNKWTRQSHSLSIGLVKVAALSPAKAETFGLMWTSSVWSCLRANFTSRFQKLHRWIETEAAPQILYEQRDETTSSLRIFGSLVGTSKAKLSCMEISVIASSSIDGGIGSWDIKTGTEQLRFKQCASPAHGLAAVGEKFLAASQLRNASGSSGSIFFWSWNKPQVEVRSFPVESVKALAANSEGTYIVGGGASGDIFLWEVASGKLLKKWHGHYRSVTCLVFSGDDSLLVSGSEDGSVRVWSLLRLFDDLQRQQQGSTLYEHDFNEHTTSVTDIVIDYGGCNAFIVSASGDGTCKRQQQGSTLYEHDFNEHTTSVTDIVIDYGGCNAFIVSASGDGTCKVWSLSKGKLLRNIIFPAAINALALDPGGSIFYAASVDSKIYVGAMNSSSDYATQSLGSVSEQGKAVTCLAYCADGNLLISGSEDGVICVWDPKSRRLVRTFSHGKGPVNNIQVVRRTVVGNSNKAQSSWKKNGSSLPPPPLEKYERSGDNTVDGIVIVDPPPLSDVPVYSSYHSADLINEQVRELQQQGSAATEIEMERLKLEYKKSLQMNDQWQKNYENLLQVVMEEELNGSSS